MKGAINHDEQKAETRCHVRSLTACVAAQPMAAHAVEGPDPAEDNAAPQAEPVAESSTPAPVAEEGEKQEKVGEQEEFTPPR